jgi:hypothetical protein
MAEKQRTILMSEAKLAEALKFGWISPADLEGDEFIFYFVPATERMSGAWMPEPITHIYKLAQKDNPSRLLFDLSTPSQNTLFLQRALETFGLIRTFPAIVSIFKGAHWREIDAFYKEHPHVRVLGPRDSWSGFEVRWREGYANKPITV